MLDSASIRTQFGRVAAQYDTHADLQQRVRCHALELAKKQFTSGGRVLDLGSGTGALADDASGCGWRMIQLDIAEGMCRYARKRGGLVIQASAESLPIESESLDGVFSSLMLQWVNAPQQVFHEIARVLRPGGKAVIAVPVTGTLRELAQAFAAVDDAPHLSSFQDSYTIMGYANTARLSCLQLKQQTITEYVADVIQLMRGLQAIGATNASHERKRGLTTPRQFALLEQAYQKQRTPQGLPVTWQIVFMVLTKENS